MLLNGSPHKNGCTYTALCEVSEALNEQGVDTDIFWIGNKPLSGCIACKTCIKNNKCVFHDTVNEFLDIAGDYDGFVFGTPDQVKKDLEGMQVMRVLGNNMAFFLQCKNLALKWDFPCRSRNRWCLRIL